jgi:hypothetical protein
LTRHNGNLAQHSQRKKNLKKVTAAGCDRLIRNSPVVSRTRNDRIRLRLPRGLHIDRQTRTKLVKPADNFLERHDDAQLFILLLSSLTGAAVSRSVFANAR